MERDLISKGEYAFNFNLDILFFLSQLSAEMTPRKVRTIIKFTVIRRACIMTAAQSNFIERLKRHVFSF